MKYEAGCDYRVYSPAERCGAGIQKNRFDEYSDVQRFLRMQWIERTTRPAKDKTRKEETEEGERERNRERESEEGREERVNYITKERSNDLT